MVQGTAPMPVKEQDLGAASKEELFAALLATVTQQQQQQQPHDSGETERCVTA